MQLIEAERLVVFSLAVTREDLYEALPGTQRNFIAFTR